MKLKYMFLNDIDESEVEKFISAAPKNLQDKINRYKLKNDRLRSAAGYMLIKELYCEKLTKDNCPQILFSDKGKPYFESHPLYFSISHSADLIVCAINEKEIGIDVEKISHFNPKLIDRICNDDEREYIGYSIENFFKIWTAKEAYSKLCGLGIPMGMKNINVDFKNSLVENKKLIVNTIEDYIVSIVTD